MHFPSALKFVDFFLAIANSYFALLPFSFLIAFSKDLSQPQTRCQCLPQSHVLKSWFPTGRYLVGGSGR